VLKLYKTLSLGFFAKKSNEKMNTSRSLPPKKGDFGVTFNFIN